MPDQQGPKIVSNTLGEARLPRCDKPWLERGLSAEERLEAYRAHTVGLMTQLVNGFRARPTDAASRSSLEQDADLLLTEARLIEEITPSDFCKVVDARQLLSSFKHHDDLHMTECRVPAGLSDVEAMAALNHYARALFPEIERPIISVADFRWYEEVGGAGARDKWQERIILIQSIAPHASGISRPMQKLALDMHGHSFAQPVEQALVAGIAACLSGGRDLFGGWLVRGAVPGFSIRTDPVFGITVSDVALKDDEWDRAAASAVVSPWHISLRN